MKVSADYMKERNKKSEKKKDLVSEVHSNSTVFSGVRAPEGSLNQVLRCFNGSVLKGEDEEKVQTGSLLRKIFLKKDEDLVPL